MEPAWETDGATMYHGDCVPVMNGLPAQSVGLVLGSPPYEDAREYGELGFCLSGQDWVDWMVEVVRASLRVSRGLVAFVVAGRTKNYSWSGTPALLHADLIRAGITLRNPPVFHRQGIPGSGGPDWWRSDYETIICASQPGRLPWSDNLACGWPCKYETGGAFSYRTQDGRRINESKHNNGSVAMNGRRRGRPEITNPGNVLHGTVGKGHMGSVLSHENEAPYPEWLAERFVRSFCAPGEPVLDPFSGSGTTGAVAKRFGRQYIGIDTRESQVELTLKRWFEAEEKAEGAK